MLVSSLRVQMTVLAQINFILEITNNPENDGCLNAVLLV